jgi:hypothetical protein
LEQGKVGHFSADFNPGKLDFGFGCCIAHG